MYKVCLMTIQIFDAVARFLNFQIKLWSAKNIRYSDYYPYLDIHKSFFQVSIMHEVRFEVH